MFLAKSDQLLTFHLPSDTHTDLKVTTQGGDLNEETRSRISFLLCLDEWIFQTAPVNCNLPTSIEDLLLYSLKA
ncbi:hypothetical protein BT69DRAFT_711787 [Atractiella rhizophila]|nr:hypothetical protein BT69DRAFT_711787 [Atractiella rhizophila]